nr:immunoglobulin light chain junction region [Macaca mulatta]
CVQAIAFPWTF